LPGYHAAMSRNDIVRRTQDAAWRSAQVVPETLERNRYDEECDAIGRNLHTAPELTSAYRRIDSVGDFLTHWFVIVLLSLMTFAAILGIMLWRDGVFDHLITHQPTPVAERSWMRGIAEATRAATKPPVPATAEDAPPNEIEKMLNPPPQRAPDTTAAEAESEAEAAAE
jgi:hypothetical protein